MKFEKGHAKKGGRSPGSKNKVPLDIKTRIAALIDEQFETVQAKLSELDAKEHVTQYIKLLEFILPKQRENKIDVAAKMGAMSDEQLNELIDHILKQP